MALKTYWAIAIEQSTRFGFRKKYCFYLARRLGGDLKGIHFYKKNRFVAFYKHEFVLGKD
jgi:hypothetical protein